MSLRAFRCAHGPAICEPLMPEQALGVDLPSPHLWGPLALFGTIEARSAPHDARVYISDFMSADVISALLDISAATPMIASDRRRFACNADFWIKCPGTGLFTMSHRHPIESSLRLDAAFRTQRWEPALGTEQESHARFEDAVRVLDLAIRFKWREVDPALSALVRAVDESAPSEESELVVMSFGYTKVSDILQTWRGTYEQNTTN